MKSVVVSNPDILSGTPVFAGTRVPVKNLTDYLEGGSTLDEFLDDFPSVDARQVEIYRRMTPSQRLEQAMQMNGQMRELMDSGLRATHPQFSSVERSQEIARRIRHARG